MNVRDTITEKIKKGAFISAGITDQTDLYADLGYDSLSFITLLSKIEESFSVTFDIAEMETCLNVGRLIAIVENKIKERQQ